MKKNVLSQHRQYGGLDRDSDLEGGACQESQSPQELQGAERSDEQAEQLQKINDQVPNSTSRDPCRQVAAGHDKPSPTRLPL